MTMHDEAHTTGARTEDRSAELTPAGRRGSLEASRPTRRQLVKAIGLGGAVVAGGGIALTSWRASSQGVFSAGQGPAYAAWDAWDHGEGPMALVRAAVLSANPHNSQPWRFRVSASTIDLYVNRDRNIGAIDPFRREQQIGLGCSLENLLIAGRARGYSPKATLLPDPGDASLIARVVLRQGIETDLALYRAIPKRHTHRAPFDTSRALAQETLDGLDRAVADIEGAGVVWISSSAVKREMGQLIVEAAKTIADDREQSADSFRWWRDRWSDIQRHKDGMTIDAAGLPALTTALGKILPPETREQNDAAWIQQTRDNYVRSAAAFGIVVVKDAGDKVQRINGGRLYQRLHLTAESRGLAMQPLNQLTERIDREAVLGLRPRFADAVAGLVSEPGWQPLMSFRIGYPSVAPARSPRRPAETVLITGEGEGK